jgi:hypothetical protein
MRISKLELSGRIRYLLAFMFSPGRATFIKGS